MSHFKLENDINQLVKMDGPVSSALGPVPRWQRKASENSINSCSMNGSSAMLSSSLKDLSLQGNVSLSKTPTRKTPSGKAKTPSGKTPSGTGKMSAKKSPKTPKEEHGDRFIPCRSQMQFEVGYHKLQGEVDMEEEALSSPGKKEFRRAMREGLTGGSLENVRIMAYCSKPPAAPEGHVNGSKVLYSQSNVLSARKPPRHIPRQSERILDAPSIKDDYYLNILDWSINNHLAIALGKSIYIWNASTGEIHELFSLDSQTEYVSSLAWIGEGTFLAVGLSTGDIQLWEVGVLKRVRIMGGHTGRVGSLAWNQHILSSGSRSGNIHHSDVRIAQHHVATLSSHTQEVCGLKWSVDGRYLASGGNDNIINVWPSIPGRIYTQNQPLHTFTEHQAAVKGLAWCPWQPHVLASGGGTNDRCIRFWNVNMGTCLNSVDTKSQVCALLWSAEYKEIISSHGYANNQLIIWKYPSMDKVAELTGHTQRVLHLALSPDGTTVASAAADETLRLWKCFAVDPSKKKKDAKPKASPTQMKFLGIR
ncbi:unnamed protein product [Darwinula stevensoni]|uniref:CDC20/Fizzy WD40 domain-containing protein n=1 Tax=Darwinula stevensoni TaxID=69355 RepID=A0A7R8X7V8_9CRUS|nr:unnamed protein product [Darwinula stevensoni]CAG0887290.1 unnamed protein product [Darwinula stevensoni]